MRSPIAPAERERYTPSMNTPTEGSMPGLLAPLPKPRITKLVCVEVCSVVTRSDVTMLARSVMSWIDAFWMVSTGVTVTATGTSCKVCSRLVAVTTISSSAVTSCAVAVPASTAAATARATGEYDFM